MDSLKSYFLIFIDTDFNIPTLNILKLPILLITNHLFLNLHLIKIDRHTTDNNIYP